MVLGVDSSIAYISNHMVAAQVDFVVCNCVCWDCLVCRYGVESLMYGVMLLSPAAAGVAGKFVSDGAEIVSRRSCNAM